MTDKPREWTDADALRILQIMGESFDYQLQNTRYLASRGYDNAESLALMEKADRLRNLDKESNDHQR